MPLEATESETVKKSGGGRKLGSNKRVLERKHFLLTFPITPFNQPPQFVHRPDGCLFDTPLTVYIGSVLFINLDSSGQLLDMGINYR